MTAVKAVLDRARGELGVTEVPLGSNNVKYGEWYGLNRHPWCAMFVSWVFYHENMPLAFSTSKGFAYTPAGVAAFKAQGRWYTSNPKPGDVVFFDFPGDRVNRVSHVGIAESVRADGTIICIEGNTNDRVMRRARKLGIVGYGRPAYPDAQEDKDMPLSTEERNWIKETVADMYRLLARAEINGKRDPAHYANSIAGLRDYVREVEEDMYRLLARGEIDGKRDPAHYADSIAGLREELLAQQSKIDALQQELSELKRKLETTASSSDTAKSS